jgi:hypothetical protein
MKRFLLATVVLALGCATAPDYPQAPEIDPKFLGTWRVRTINGEALPFVASQSASSRTEIQEGSITTGNGGVFTSNLVVVTTVPGQITGGDETDGGNFSVSGNTLTFQFVKAATTATGTLSHDTLTVVEGSLSLAMTR